MFRSCTLVSAFCVLVLAAASIANADDKPSSGAQGMAGAKGTFEFKPTDWIEGTTTWWTDTDGVDPGVAGCHIGTDAQGNPNGRMFGEACLPNGLLGESNPGVDELHSHTNDIGHPDTFDCNEWCAGEGASSGECTVAAAPPCAQSAMCVCN
jgi:hypothetical protein